VKSVVQRRNRSLFGFSPVCHADEIENARIDEGVGELTEATGKKYGHAIDNSIGITRESVEKGGRRANEFFERTTW